MLRFGTRAICSAKTRTNFMSTSLLVLGTGSTAYGGFHILDSRLKFQPPMDRNFFETSIVKLKFNERKFPALFFFHNLQLSNSLEKTWSDIDVCSKLTNNLGGKGIRIISMSHDYTKLEKLFQEKSARDTNFKNNIDCQKKWVGEDGCIGPLADWEARELTVDLFSKLKPSLKPYLSSLLKCILEHTELKGIATFNYDLSVEIVWNIEKFKRDLYYYDPDHASGLVNGVPLYKLHGSINWLSEFVSSRSQLWKEKISNDINELPVKSCYKQGDFFEDMPDKVIQALIIPPVVFKQNISLDLQNDARSLLFKGIWSELWKKLINVDNLIFVGFSFPETDSHAKIFFSEAHRRKPFKRVIVNTGSSESKARYQSIFDKNVVIPFDKGIQDLVIREDELIALLK